ncbi:Soluble quino protein glucose dehydrogenase [Pleurostoma richardsiae]|uniref:Soluble quino protein glucose dehydrogenase n=1 Tax=Pleurostoma richardsiae TaxID=41990 RepID=A0AA38RD02_9PEZI|nr:Soluble quino protein glucose dehydrogenase [Pleurostoma richardsiae]
MKSSRAASAAVVVAAACSTCAAASCSNILAPAYSTPSVASGWTAQLVVNGLTKPRSIEFDTKGALLVVDSGVGIRRITFTDNGGTCLQVDQNTLLVNQTSLNHGLALSSDGSVLYASSAAAVFAWSYDADAGTVSSDPQTVVDNMSNNDLTTRTLLMSQKQDGMLVVSRGSGDDDDVAALDVSSGLSQIRAFTLANLTSTSEAYDFDSAGRLLGWGLRNSVGVAEHPVTGGIYSVENSIDGATRDGQDIHENNPGEELNFHGFLNGTTADQGGNYGYPNCYALWNTSIPDLDGLTVGDQFSMTQNSTLNDTVCADDYVAPRLTMPAHYAPLDIKFTSDGATAYISFHGSFDKTNPVGYRVAEVSFNPTTGEPVAAADSTDALTDVISNPDNTKCPGACFRPVGLAWDSEDRLFMSSDATGEIYVLLKSSSTATSSASGTMVTPTASAKSAAGRAWAWETKVLGAAAAIAATLFLM